MKKIMLVCAAGMSTSLLVNKMKSAATEANEQVEIEAIAKEHLSDRVNEANVLLLGPQIGYLEDEIKEEYSELNIPISVINSVDYGMMNGKKILNETLSVMGE